MNVLPPSVRALCAVPGRHRRLESAGRSKAGVNVAMRSAGDKLVAAQIHRIALFTHLPHIVLTQRRAPAMTQHSHGSRNHLRSIWHSHDPPTRLHDDHRLLACSVAMRLTSITLASTRFETGPFLLLAP